MLVPLQSPPPESPSIQFMENIKMEKEISISWNKKRKKAEDKALSDIEEK
jgi:hypothetical protein